MNAGELFVVVTNIRKQVFKNFEYPRYKAISFFARIYLIELSSVNMKLSDIEKHGAAYWIAELGVYQYRTQRNSMYRDDPNEVVRPWVSNEFEIPISEVSQFIKHAIQRGPEVVHWMTNNIHYYYSYSTSKVYEVLDDENGTIMSRTGESEIPSVVIYSEMARRHENVLAWRNFGKTKEGSTTASQEDNPIFKKVLKNSALGLMGFAVGGPFGAMAAISLGNLETDRKSS